jgi:hypothetical protein
MHRVHYGQIVRWGMGCGLCVQGQGFRGDGLETRVSGRGLKEKGSGLGI